MDAHYVFCHGWGSSKAYWKDFLIHSSIKNYSLLDLGYFGKKDMCIEKTKNNLLVGVGHSLGFLKLLHMNVTWDCLIGIQAFTHFLGFSQAMRKQRLKEWRAMKSGAYKDIRETLKAFYARSYIQPRPSPFEEGGPHTVHHERLLKDLHGLIEDFPTFLPCETLMIHSAHDPIVPQALVEEHNQYWNYTTSTPYALHWVDYAHAHALGQDYDPHLEALIRSVTHEKAPMFL
jgi:pimeloyl-[acyl-carrier protein] methyl ester esterase